MRVFWSILSAVFVVIVICLLLFIFKFEYILGRILTSKFGTTVRIENVVFRKNEFDAEKFVIKNPPSYTTPSALKINQFDVEAPFWNYFKKVIHIKEIELHNVEFTLEFDSKKGSTSNWSQLLDNLSAGSNGSSNASSEDSSSDRYAVIGLLKINNLTVNMITPGRKTETRTYRNLQFRNVVTKKGDIVRRITQVVIYHMIFNFRNWIKFPVQFGGQATDGVLNIFEHISPFSSGSSKNE